MKINKDKLQESIRYCDALNNAKFMDLDFSQLTANGEDLEKSKKEDLIWMFERKSTIEILRMILDGKIK
jgi:hypothetical protein